MTDSGAPSNAHYSIPKSLVGWVVVVIVALVWLFFVLVRRFDWTLGWIYVGIMIVAFSVNMVCLLRWNPVLIKRRMQYGKGTKVWDIFWLILFAPVTIAIFVVAVIEARASGWGVSTAGWLLGFSVFVFGWTLIIWSMVVNPFFEKTVRIQTEHGHSVVDTGPYAYVRHPGYVGFSGWLLSTPLLLGSTWAFVPAVLAVAALMIRTVLEDRTLQAELPGYTEYADRVRFRLIPGFW